MSNLTKDLLHKVLSAHFTDTPDRSNFFQYIEYEPELPSKCIISSPDEKGMVLWKPVEADIPVDWVILEEVLGELILPELKTFYSSFWSQSIDTAIIEGDIIVTQFWNDNERRRYLAGITSRVYQLKKNGEPRRFTIAIFTDDRFISVDNNTRIVYLEDPGRRPVRIYDHINCFLEDLLSNK